MTNKDGTVKERLAVIETLLSNHLAHCELWLKVYLPLIITTTTAILALYLKR